MINVNDIKTGMTILYEGNIYTVIEFQHVKPGKGAAFVRTKLKNLRSSSTIEITFNSSIKLEKANIEKRTLSYLYNTGDNYVFMDNENYEQLEVNKSQLNDNIKYLKEGLNVDIMSYEGEILGISLPEKVTYLVTDTEMAVKGNTTSGANKDATVETGYTVKVPLFISTGDNIIISTKDGSYSSKA
ncbi:MAG: elongation factor P [Bacilli bacterium]